MSDEIKRRGIALSGKVYTGKTLWAETICRIHPGFRRMSLADGVKKHAGEKEMEDKDGKGIQDLKNSSGKGAKR